MVTAAIVVRSRCDGEVEGRTTACSRTVVVDMDNASQERVRKGPSDSGGTTPEENEPALVTNFGSDESSVP